MADNAILVLEDGTEFHGLSFGAPGETFGEAVFNTGMTGYQEILTDPSYIRQIVTMTSPMIGNYGVRPEENESSKIQAAGFVVREYSKSFSSRHPEATALGDWLISQGIVAIEGIDTRKLTRHLRECGAMRAGISTTETDPQALRTRVLASPQMAGLDLTGEATCRAPYDWGNSATARYRIAALDFGIKTNILRRLAAVGCAVRVFPATTGAAEILAMDPDGIFISNGPGDPDTADAAVETLRGLLGRRPLFGICFGHQLLARACGAKTYKLKFGHRGGNHPAKNLANGRIEISVQNHGFCVDEASLPDDVEVTHRNLNDMTVEGIRHKTLPAFAVQYHPENAPGPRDSEYLFGEFTGMMDAWKQGLR